MILDEIIKNTRRLVEERRVPDTFGVGSGQKHPSPRGFTDHIRNKEGPAIIAEIKRRSPSQGPIRPDLNPSEVAAAYETHGATAISVLTEPDYFGGSFGDLSQARSECSLPVLQKDFVIDSYQLDEAVMLNADAILLIVAALGDSELTQLHEGARQRHLDVLVEVHNREELDRALKIEPKVIGVNNRNLKTMKVDLNTSLDLAKSIPDHVVSVCESGLLTPDDVKRAWDAGFQGFLIGQAFGQAEDRDGLLAAIAKATE